MRRALALPLTWLDRRPEDFSLVAGKKSTHQRGPRTAGDEVSRVGFAGQQAQTPGLRLMAAAAALSGNGVPLRLWATRAGGRASLALLPCGLWGLGERPVVRPVRPGRSGGTARCVIGAGLVGDSHRPPLSYAVEGAYRRVHDNGWALSPRRSLDARPRPATAGAVD